MQKALSNSGGSPPDDANATAQAPAQPAVASVEKQKHFKTEGEKKFDSHAYRFWGYYMNVLISLGAVWFVERTHQGQWVIDTIAKGVSKVGVKDTYWTKYFARKSFFLAGGFAVIPPIKWLEDKKTEMVKQYNRQIYGDKADKDSQIIQSEKEVAEAPKQTWKSVMSARALALVPFYAGYALIWEPSGRLVRWTNPNLKGLNGKELRDFIEKNPAKASMGAFVDKPIAILSRDLGKLAAAGSRAFEHAPAEEKFISKCYRLVFKYVGKIFNILPKNEKAFNEIVHLDATSPAIISSVKKIDPITKKAVRDGSYDPAHSVYPYYFISESITSAMVAWGVYVITRITGPFFGKKKAESSPLAPVQKQPMDMPPVADEKQALKRDDKQQPATKIELTGLERQAALSTAGMQAR